MKFLAFLALTRSTIAQELPFCTASLDCGSEYDGCSKLKFIEFPDGNKTEDLGQLVDDALGGLGNLETDKFNKAICVTSAIRTAFEAAMKTNDDAQPETVDENYKSYLTYYEDVKLFRDSNNYFQSISGNNVDEFITEVGAKADYMKGFKVARTILLNKHSSSSCAKDKKFYNPTDDVCYDISELDGPYDSQMKKVDTYECHETCKACGYTQPTDEDAKKKACISCKDGDRFVYEEIGYYYNPSKGTCEDEELYLLNAQDGDNDEQSLQNQNCYDDETQVRYNVTIGDFLDSKVLLSPTACVCDTSCTICGTTGLRDNCKFCKEDGKVIYKSPGEENALGTCLDFSTLFSLELTQSWIKNVEEKTDSENQARLSEKDSLIEQKDSQIEKQDEEIEETSAKLMAFVVLFIIFCVMFTFAMAYICMNMKKMKMMSMNQNESALQMMAQDQTNASIGDSQPARAKAKVVMKPN